MRTPNFSSLGGLVLIALGLLIFGSVQVQAGASNKNGNPFGNGTFFQTTGTFSAVIRGQNLSGTMLFSTGANTNGGTNSSGGSCVISYLGGYSTNTNTGYVFYTGPGVYNGNAAGLWDPSSGNISGQFWGGYTLSGTNSSVIYPEIYNSNSFPVPINVVSNVVIPPVPYTDSNGVTTYVPGTNYSITNTIYVEPIGSNSFQDSVMMNGSFDGSVQNKYPNQTFSAQGTISQQQLSTPGQGLDAQSVSYDPGTDTYTTNYNQEGTLPVQMSETLKIAVSVQGIRISDAYSSFNTISNAVPYTITTYTITNISTLQNAQ